MRFVSVNTWLIVINVLVFILNNVVFQNVQRGVGSGTYYLKGVTEVQAARGQVERRLAQLDRDGTFHCPIFDPETMQVDPLGRPVPVAIGYERFRVQPEIEAVGHFSTWKFWKEGQLWRLITFQFLHFDHWHLLFNMLGLWFVGGLVEQYLGRRRYAVFYLVCGVCGALAYMLLNLFGYFLLQAGAKPSIPFLLFDDPYTPLIGASAGVFGVLMAASFIAPTAIVQVMLIIPMKLRTAVYIFLALALFNLYKGGHNAGGDAAHVGGALAGAFLIRRPYIMRDLVGGFGLFPRRQESKPIGHQSDRATSGSEALRAGPAAAAPARYAAFDRIIEKARVEGSESLTEAERAIVRGMMQSERDS